MAGEEEAILAKSGAGVGKDAVGRRAGDGEEYEMERLGIDADGEDHMHEPPVSLLKPIFCMF
jgi:hypothetical protein